MPDRSVFQCDSRIATFYQAESNFIPRETQSPCTTCQLTYPTSVHYLPRRALEVCDYSSLLLSEKIDRKSHQWIAQYHLPTINLWRSQFFFACFATSKISPRDATKLPSRSIGDSVKALERSGDLDIIMAATQFRRRELSWKIEGRGKVGETINIQIFLARTIVEQIRVYNLIICLEPGNSW